MKRSVKIGLTLMILGAVLFGVGWMNHGDKSVVWNRDTRGFKTVQKVKKSFRPGDYHQIVVDAKAPVTIKVGDTNRVTVSYVDGLKDLPSVDVSKQTLTITGGQAMQHESFTVFGLSDSGTTNGGVLVTVPRGKQLDNLTVKKGSGKVSLRTLQAKQMTIQSSDEIELMDLKIARALTVKSTDGDIWADQITAKKLRINTDDGDIGVSNSHLAAVDNQLSTADGDIRLSETHLGGGRIDSSDGDIHLQQNQLSKRLKVFTNDGDIHAYIGKSAGAKVLAKDADMSDITVQGKNRRSGYWLRQSASAQYQLRTNDGDIRVANGQ
ncbi:MULTISPECIES: DUF4097 family beta strand repeat-containing protein [Lactobacillaceae]|uniref:DUF4097 family beta strand repeat-containing protein n=1 Tax=Lactobacillaceae TaxID=33958 RepID=UPI0014570E0F|nr:DUF4097 family beta strand repeat-containing protein [Lactobacillus sp. HBUAS51381]NLR10610.1 DUF4097 domain-containing protein [Lactobacillus sp. HBUAS51381]